MKRLFAFLIVGSLLLAADDGRADDRLAIRAHIERIFDAFIHKDAAELRATHARNWLGYLEGSRSMVRGVEPYMDHSGHFDPNYGMASYKIREFDIIFKGDAAFVAFVADVESYFPGGRGTRVLRITDFYAKENGKWIQAGSDTDLHPESVAANAASLRRLDDADRKSLMEAREAVWRAFFAGDRERLLRLLPEELLTVEAFGGEWGNRKSVLEGSAQFAASGGKLIRLEFPKTEMQVYGSTVIIYTTYLFETEQGGTRSTSSGRATEVFVKRGGAWLNTSWHLDQVGNTF